MGAAVGQVPDYVEMVTRWCKKHTRMPVLVKLTPNVTNILGPARAAKKRRRRRRVADQHGELDHRRRSRPHVAAAGGRRQGHAWRLLRAGGEADRAATWWPRSRRDAECAGMPISGHRRHRHLARRGGVHALGAGTVQVCTAAMHYGFKIIDDLVDGLSNWLDGKGHAARGRHRRPRAAQRHRLAASQPQLQDRGARSTRTSASSAASATSPARTPRTRRSRPAPPAAGGATR